MNYEYELDVTGDNALAYVLELAGSNKKTLEVGAGSGMITKHLVRTNGCDVVALEINPASVEKLKSYIDGSMPSISMFRAGSTVWRAKGNSTRSSLQMCWSTSMILGLR
jgi:uncharacterized UPF0146 family protein